VSDDITCPKCEECGWFTLHEIGVGVYARCQNCHHEIEIEIIRR
jgi:predicted Zn-ribbon and HTH transcriptional regulator